MLTHLTLFISECQQFKNKQLVTKALAKIAVLQNSCFALSWPEYLENVLQKVHFLIKLLAFNW